MHKGGQTTVVTSSMTMKWNQAIFVDSFRIILYFGYEPQIRTRIDSMFLSISSWRVNWCDIGFNCHVTALWVPRSCIVYHLLVNYHVINYTMMIGLSHEAVTAGLVIISIYLSLFLRKMIFHSVGNRLCHVASRESGCNAYSCL